MPSLIKTNLKFKSNVDAFKFHILAISQEENLKLSPADINVAVEVYLHGYSKDFFTVCVEKKFFKSEQTVRNSIAKLTKKNVLTKKYGDRTLNTKFLPLEKDDLIFMYTVSYEQRVV
jgi:mRNA-degrading endonuclease YafQ of YafQ-DinJ toxin-antitoxin module